MELVYHIGNLLSLGLLWLIVAFAYRTLWKALIVVTPAGPQTVDLFTDEDPSEEFWLVPAGESEAPLPTRGLRVGQGVTLGRAESCDLRSEDSSVSDRHLRIAPHRDWCSIESLGAAAGYRIEGEPVQGHSLLKEGQCLSVGDVSVRLVRRPI